MDWLNSVKCHKHHTLSPSSEGCCGGRVNTAMDAQAPIPPTRSLTLDLPPSCMQFCPLHPAYFVVGTYNLQKDDNAGGQVHHVGSEDDSGTIAKKPQSRDGSLVVFRVDGEDLSV